MSEPVKATAWRTVEVDTGHNRYGVKLGQLRNLVRRADAESLPDHAKVLTRAAPSGWVSPPQLRLLHEVPLPVHEPGDG